MRSAAETLVDQAETQIAAKISAAADRIQALNHQVMGARKGE